MIKKKWKKLPDYVQKNKDFSSEPMQMRSQWSDSTKY